MSLKNSVISSLRWVLFAKFGSQLVSWACTFVVMRLLHPDDYGLIAMATVFVGLAIMINEMGLTQALVQAKSIGTRELRQALGLVTLINSAFFLAFCLAAPAIASFFGEARLVQLVPALASQFLLLIFFVVPSALLERDMAFRYKSINEVITILAGSLLTLYLAWTGWGVWSLVLGNLSAMALRVVCLNLQRPFWHWPSFDFTGFSGFVRYGGYTTANRILWYLYSQADVFIIGRMLGKTQLGYYSVGMQLASLPLQKVAAILGQVGHAAYSRLQEEGERVAQYVLKASRLMAFVAFPVFFGLSAVTPELITVVAGTQWLPAILPMQLLALAFPLRAMNLTLTPVVSGLGRPDVTTRTVIAAILVLPAAFYLGARLDGLRGVSLVWVLVFPLWACYAMHISLRLIGLPLRRFLATALWPALYAGLMFAVVQGLRLATDGMPALPRLGLLSVSGAAVYAGLMWGTHRAECRELLGFVRKS